MFEIRSMEYADSEVVARLSKQLGYEASAHQILNRFSEILKRELEHRVVVAVDDLKKVVGFLHVRINFDVVSAAVVEVAAIVVDETKRGTGAGKALMHWAENWARESGFNFVSLKSRSTRTDSHQFYEKIGYKNIKSSYTFKKEF